MISKIRPLTILLILIVLCGFVTIPYNAFIKKDIVTFNIASVIAMIVLLLFLAGLFGIIWLTLIVKLDKESKTITFFYPLRLSSTTIKFENIVGFRYKYLSAQINYKSLQVKTINGQTFTFSDFETKNLREFEKEFLELFDLRTGKSFNKLSQQQKEIEIENSRTFDIRQAKEIRFMLYLVIALLMVVFVKFIQEIIEDEIKNSIMTLILATISVMVLISTIIKLKRTNSFLSKHAKSGTTDL